MPLELILGAVDVPEPLQRIRAHGKTEARPVGRMHHAVRTDVKRLVEELPHHRHPALADLEDVAIGGCHRDVNAGGMTEIRRIAALTSAQGVRLAPHAWGSGVLFAASIHVAMAATNCHILEVSQGYMPMMWELFNEPFDIRPDGMVHAPDRPGLGFTLRADALERFRYVDGPEYEF